MKFKSAMTSNHLMEIKAKAASFGIRVFDTKNEVEIKKFVLSKEFVALLKSKMHF